MKDTGIVRKVDELGRIVIPMEIRKKQKIEEGTELEIYLNKKGEIVLKKQDVRLCECGYFVGELDNYCSKCGKKLINNIEQFTTN